MPENDTNGLDIEKSTSPTRKSFLERVEKVLLPILTILGTLRTGSGSSVRWIIYALIIAWLLVKEIIRWQAKLLGG
jgi:hypothetical protein